MTAAGALLALPQATTLTHHADELRRFRSIGPGTHGQGYPGRNRTLNGSL